jgi:hypothetical protein
MFDEEKPVRIVKDKKYPNMYRLQWENGDISVSYFDPDKKIEKDKGPHTYGLYNLTRAKDILKNYYEYKRAYELNSPELEQKQA